MEKEKQARIAAKEALRKQKQSQVEAEVNRNKRPSHKNDKSAGDEERGSVINDLNILEKLKKVLEESDDEYKMPFEEPNDLMSIFENLEEKNLFLIQQG